MIVTEVPVLFNVRESPSVHRIGLGYDVATAGVRPARFFMLALPDRSVHLLPRPFSISDAYVDGDGRGVAEFLYKPVGRMTRRLRDLREGDALLLAGPMGNGFPDPRPGRRPVLVAGGIGNAPFALQVRRFASGAAGADPSQALLLLGGRGAGDVYIQPFVRASGVEVVEVTDDGSLGERGTVTDALARRLPDLGPIEVYGCGPTPMLRALRELALENGFPAHLALEEHMACGYGVCNACVVERCVEGVPPGEGPYVKLCTDGPVLEAGEVLL